MTKTEQIIRRMLGFSLSTRVFAKMAKERRKKRHQEAVREIECVNGGYFIRPETKDHADVRLPLDGPEQLRLQFEE